MNRAVPALFALLLCCSLPAMTVVAAAPSGSSETASVTPIEAEETTNRLSLHGDIRSENVESGPNFGIVAASTDDALRLEQNLHPLESEFEGANNEERQELIEAAHDRIDERTDEVKEREHDAIIAHAEGNLSDDELLQTFIRNYNEVNELSNQIGTLEVYADEVVGYSPSFPTTQFDLHQSDVRTLIEQVHSGQTEATSPLLLETSQDGYSLSIIQEGEYIREISRFDNRDMNASSQFDGSSAAWDRIEELYPWANENTDSPHARGSGAAQLYFTDLPHPQGELSSYLDAGTGDVFYETQTLRLNSLPSSQERQFEDGNSLAVSINATPANGPFEVTTTNPTTNESVDATVTINEQEVGQTGEDGTLWVIPPSDAYGLGVESDSGSINTTRAGL